jgi:hypothetical protein
MTTINLAGAIGLPLEQALKCIPDCYGLSRSHAPHGSEKKT